MKTNPLKPNIAETVADILRRVRVLETKDPNPLMPTTEEPSSFTPRTSITATLRADGSYSILLGDGSTGVVPKAVFEAIFDV